MSPMTEERGKLGRLPAELQNAVFAQLDYPAAIFLSATSQYFRHVNPVKLVSDINKEKFILTAEGFPRHAGDQAFGCFKCYRVKPRDAFAQKQTTKKNSKGHSKHTMRFCLDCGTAKNIYTRGTQIRKTDGVLYWKCYFCPVLKDGLYCTYCTKCHDCLRLSDDFDSEWCPRCGRNRIEGEKRQGQLGDLASALGIGLQMSDGEVTSPAWSEDGYWWDD